MASEAARDFFGGTLGGMTGILAGHPLDTAKTRLQAMPQFDKSSTQRVLVETVRGEGMRALYKGISFPFCSTALINAVVFSVQGISERTLRAVFSDDRPQLTGFLGGCIAGLAQSPLVCAVDLVKTQRQVQMGWAGERPLQIFRTELTRRMIHPVDVVKARIQALPTSATSQEREPWHAISTGFSREGTTFFLRGFGAAMARAFAPRLPFDGGGVEHLQ
eukprot:g33561.t1